MEKGQKIHLLRCIVFAYASRTYKPMCTSLPHVYFYVHNSNNRLVLKKHAHLYFSFFQETGVTAFAHFDEYLRIQRLEAFLNKFYQLIVHRTYYAYEDDDAAGEDWEWYSDEEDNEEDPDQNEYATEEQSNNDDLDEGTVTAISI